MRLAHFFIIFVLCLCTSVDAKTRKARGPILPPPVYGAIVIEAHTGKILFNDNADGITYPASLTKMMTLYLLFEAVESGKISPHHKFPVSAHASRQSPSKLYLKPGDSISVRDALLALMTKSANDVAVVVAEGLAGTEANFANRMTKKARALGMNHTTFQNASGLPNKDQKTTARDMATLSLAIYKHFPRYYSLFSTKSFVYKGQKHGNHNHLLGNVPGVDGIKTGFIVASGWNLSASASRSGQRVIAVVLGGKTRLWRDKKVAELIEVGFNKLNKGHVHGVPLPEDRPMAELDDAEKEPAISEDVRPEKKKKKIPTVKKAVIEKKPESGKWGIQVGAFNSQKRAREVAAQTQKQIDEVSSSSISVLPIKKTRGKLYQARLVNLSEKKARNACRQITKKGQSCLPLQIRK